jgi:hypothetical protein
VPEKSYGARAEAQAPNVCSIYLVIHPHKAEPVPGPKEEHLYGCPRPELHLHVSKDKEIVQDGRIGLFVEAEARVETQPISELREPLHKS